MTLTPINELRPYPGNARRGDVGMIAHSLETHGQYKPIVAVTGEKEPELAGVIVAGNHTWQAAQELGWENIDVHFIDVDKKQARDIVLIDNKANDAATYDVDALVDLLTDYPDLDGTGFTRDDVDALLETIGDTDDDSDVPGLPDDPEPTQWNVLVECDTEADARTLKGRLTAEGYTAGIA
ncbi:ParB N-terminal domain-containing protein [Corynebacterium timonense]|uniref:ParB-like nuclease domain-containing protein n=1 Tax=Corynebacterium timonense TaxID=441500 RepID=A0A1H1LQP2_9CORY|nr:ParB N-terminal domain-containing protein [Corynebacterium timonense]SDR76861.1 ParB-like nuclease domain-containing protein [Corynebacterium timonense]